jgi:hypothetical protein
MMVLCEPKHVEADFIILIVLIIWQSNIICVHQLDKKSFEAENVSQCWGEYTDLPENKQQYFEENRITKGFIIRSLHPISHYKNEQINDDMVASNPHGRPNG